jgi:hypothetical protein
MAKIKVVLAENVSLKRDGKVHRPGDVIETQRDDEVEQWLRHGYVSEVKRARKR